MATLLRRYWFVTNPGNRFGPGNLGETEFSKDHAFQTLIKTLKSNHLESFAKNLNTETEVIEDIDINLLDQGHIIPNIGTVAFRGVWYPNLNMGNI